MNFSAEKTVDRPERPYIIVEAVSIESLEERVSFFIEEHNYVPVGNISVIAELYPSEYLPPPKFRYYQSLVKLSSFYEDLPKVRLRKQRKSYK